MDSPFAGALVCCQEWQVLSPLQRRVSDPVRESRAYLQGIWSGSTSLQVASLRLDQVVTCSWLQVRVHKTAMRPWAWSQSPNSQAHGVQFPRWPSPAPHQPGCPSAPPRCLVSSAYALLERQWRGGANAPVERWVHQPVPSRDQTIEPVHQILFYKRRMIF